MWQHTEKLGTQRVKLAVPFKALMKVYPSLLPFIALMEVYPSWLILAV